MFVSANLVEIFRQKQIMNIVSIKRMPGDDREDKSYIINHEQIIIIMTESLFGIIHLSA